MFVNKPFLKACIFAVCVVAMALTGYAQELKFTRINAETGLSQGVVNCILNDSKGFMWIGTQDGLNRYDGYQLKVLKHSSGDSNTISSNFIYSMYEDREGMLWIGTKEGGLNCFNPLTGKVTRYLSSNKPGSISNNAVRCIVEDAEGTIWVGTDEGLNAFDRKTKTFKRYLHSNNDPKSLTNNNVWALLVDRKGSLWVGTRGGGLHLFDKKAGGFLKFPAPLGFFQNNPLRAEQLQQNSMLVRSLYEDKEGYLWVGTDAGGCGIFDIGSRQYLKFLLANEGPDNLAHNRVVGIGEDEFGVMWLATYGGGLDAYNKRTGGFSHYKYEEKNITGLSSDETRCLYIDAQNTVWVGTSGAGVCAYFRDNNKFEYYKKNESNEEMLRSSFVMTLLEDRDGLLWIGTNGKGISTLDLRSKVFSYDKNLNDQIDDVPVLCMTEDDEGLLWIGTWGYGAVSFDKRTGKTTEYPGDKNGLTNGTIITILQDREGILWFGTYRGGLFAFDKSTGKFTNYNTENGLGSNNVYGLFVDRNGTLWVGTEGGGLCERKKDGTFRAYTRKDENSISSNTVYCINQDKSGNLWVGTTSGLNKFNPQTGKFISYQSKDGLPNDNIYSVMIDKEENIWMTSNKGVSRFNPKVKNMDGLAFRNYDMRDGLQGEEFNQGAYFQGRSGQMFVGGINGFNAFYPDRIKANSHVPPVYISSYKRFGKEVQLDTNITQKKYIELSWRDNFFSFEFVALDYVMPGQNKYSYKMEGVDDDWSPAAPTRYASYTQLQGGDYIFKVRACNNDGIWNEKGAELHIRINPPFWKTNWFYSLCMLAGIAGVFGFIKYRTASIKRENKILEAKVEERTRELAEKNRDITSSIQYAQRIQEAILPPLKQIFSHFTDAFILYRPKDIVSGDFYWFGEKNRKKIIAAVDCTGHGVPGAFMSMIGHNLLNQIIVEKGITEPATILNELHRGVQSALKQGSSVVDTSDGMDVSICSIDMDKKELQFAGAYRPLFIINYNDFEKVDGNKFPIGGSHLDADRAFTNHTRFLKKGDTIYMFTDGYADQFGGENGKKFMVKRFHELLLNIQDKSLQEQGKILESNLEQWRGSYEQVDDVLVIGIRF